MNAFFSLRKDAANRQGVHPRMRTVADLRILAYGKGFDEVDEVCHILESSERQSLHSFIDEFFSVLGGEHLRLPN